MKHGLARVASLAALVTLAACGGGDKPVATQKSISAAGTPRGLPMTQPVSAEAASGLAGHRMQGRIDVWVQLDQHSLAQTRAALAQTTGIARKRALGAGREGREGHAEPAAIRSAMTAQRRSIQAQQASVGERLAALGAKELARVSVAHNAIAVTIDAAQLQAASALPGVVRVRPVRHYEMDLSETVPYVGAAAAQAAGTDGSGVKVAVLDSGIDYTHRNLGGAGTAAAYEAAWGTAVGDAAQTTRDGLFPTAKVVDGFDFVGEAWPSLGDRSEDEDPIDLQGHGTHVADIIAGASTDGLHKGVAPGASLIAVKVCSAVATSCNGVALLKGMDFAMDPDGNGDLSDAADVINMSLGSSYGQIEDDLTLAASNAVAAGTVVVASAGNSADKPYVTGSPAMGPGVISVAQTQVPSATQIPLVVNAPAAIAGVYGNTATVDWAPIGAGAGGLVKTALQGGAADNLACAPLPAGSLTGRIALIDRGACAISLKVDYAANAGAIGFLLALSAPGDAVSFSFGGGSLFVPTLVIQQSLGNAIKAQLGAGQDVDVSISPASAIALVGSMAGSSSRGPSVALSGIKPEIGAPGASVSAEVGTGTGETAFGGTSGAAPMVSGAAALLLSAQPALAPMQVKAMLMNNAETAVYTNPGVYPGQLAPITRIGGGELRVTRALDATALAWDADALSATLAFGAVEASQPTVLTRTLTVQNLSATARQFRLSHSFRYADDQATRAVRLTMPSTVDVPANGSATVSVQMTISPARLPSWTLDGGAQGGNGQLLNQFEFDGYVKLSDAEDTLTVPWHVLPRKAAATSAGPYRAGRSGDSLTLKNVGADVGGYDLFSLIGSSGPNGLPPPAPGDNIANIDVRSVGVRYLPPAICGANCLEFAISNYQRRSHPNYPAGFQFEIDTTGDGVPDWIIFNAESGGFAATGQNRVYVAPAAPGSSGSSVFYTDADLNSGNLIFTVLLNGDGLPPGYPSLGAAVGTTLGITLVAYDNYFTGTVTDVVAGMRFTPASPRFAQAAGALPFGAVNPAASLSVPFQRAVVDNALSSETGLLMMYRRNAGAESQEVLLP